MFWYLYAWKQELLNTLNNGVLNFNQWQAFSDAAVEAGCYMMAADMQKRLDHYTKNTLEKK